MKTDPGMFTLHSLIIEVMHHDAEALNGLIYLRVFLVSAIALEACGESDTKHCHE